MPIRGVSSTCTEMCGSGPRTGIRRPIPAATRWWTQLARHRARFGSRGVVPGTTTGRTCVQLSATATPPATAALASVLVSNQASKPRMWLISMKGGAWRVWTKGAVAQKGHASKRSLTILSFSVSFALL